MSVERDGQDEDELYPYPYPYPRGLLVLCNVGFCVVVSKMAVRLV